MGACARCVLMCAYVCASARVLMPRGVRAQGLFDVAVSYFCSKLFPQVSSGLLRSPQFPHAPQCFHTPAMMCTQVTTSNRRTHGSFSSQRILGIQCLLRLSKRKHKSMLMPPSVQLNSMVRYASAARQRNAELYEFQLVPSALGFPRIPCMNLFNSLSRAASRMDLAALPVSRAMDSDQ